MEISDLKVLIIDDDVYKTMEIQKALESNGVINIIRVRNQENAWNEIDRARDCGSSIDLIVTDMHYPLEAGLKADYEAGYILIERLKEKKMEIPVIICSTQNWNSPETLGTVWYNELRDIAADFKELLYKLITTD